MSCMGIKRLYRSRNDRMVAGVCGGFGEFFGVDPSLIRLFWVLALFLWGSGFLFYIVCWLIIPVNPVQDGKDVVSTKLTKKADNIEKKLSRFFR